MMNIKHFSYKSGFFITMFGLILSLNACTNSSTNTGSTGSVQNLNQLQSEAGLVVAVRDIQVNANSNDVYNPNQNQNNNNNTNNVNTVANSLGLNNVFGSVDVLSLGNMFVNNNNNNQNSTINAQEITVQKNNGQTVAITQATSQRFSPGEYVRIVISDGKAVVIR